MSEPLTKPIKKHRARKFFIGLLGLIIVLGIAGFAYFNLVLRPGLNKQGKAIVANAMDYEGSSIIEQELINRGLSEGVDIFVFNLVDEKGDVNPENGKVGFVHVESENVPADVTLDAYFHQIISALISSREQGVDVRQTSVFVYAGDQAIVSVLAPMDHLTAWHQGSISDEELMTHVNIKVEDLNQLKAVVEVYINDRIGQGLIDALFGK